MRVLKPTASVIIMAASSRCPWDKDDTRRSMTTRDSAQQIPVAYRYGGNTSVAYTLHTAQLTPAMSYGGVKNSTVYPVFISAIAPRAIEAMAWSVALGSW